MANHTAGSFWCAAKSSADCHREIHMLASMSVEQDFTALELLKWQRTSKGWSCPACASQKEQTND